MRAKIERRLQRNGSGQRESGYTYIELLVAVMVLLILAGAAIPLARWDQKRRMENRLRISLQMMRDAIDQYKKLTEEGLIIQSDVEQMGYPLTIEELVDGIEVGDPETAERKTVKFLQRIPIDPFSGEPEWGMRSYQDDWDSTSWGGENLYDVYSLSRMRALDGTYYKEW